MPELGLKQYVTKNTRITRLSKTTIDLVFSNFYITTKVLKRPKITDHAIEETNLCLAKSTNNMNEEHYARGDKNFNEGNVHNILPAKIEIHDENKEFNTMASETIKIITVQLT